MATVCLGRYEVTKGLLPPVCIRCGGEVALHKQKTFSWYPPWVAILILAGLLPYVIVARILTKCMTVDAPLCEQHRHHWLWRTCYVNFSLLLLLGLGFVTTILVATQDNRRGPQQDLGGFICLGLFVAALAWLISVAIIQQLAIRPTEITDRSITLTNVSPFFIEALQEERAYRREEEPRRPRRGRRYEEEDEDWEES